MTDIEFKAHYQRLCEGFSHEPSKGQRDAWYQRTKYLVHDDWCEAVTDALTGMKFPYLDRILDLAERRAEMRRRHAVKVEQRMVETELAGPLCPDDYFLRLAIRRWIKGERPMKTLILDEYQAAYGRGEPTAWDDGRLKEYLDCEAIREQKGAE